MSPAIRLGGEQRAIDSAAPAAAAVKLHRGEATIGGIPTRSLFVDGDGAPTVFLHGWMDNADTWRTVLGRLGGTGRPGVAYDLPGFGTAPPLADGDVLDQLVDFAAAAVHEAADETGKKVVLAGNSLGGWVALRAAEQEDLPLAGIVPIGPAGIEMAPFFFTADRIPVVSSLIGVPAPVPAALVRSVLGRFYRALGFAEGDRVDQAVIDRFTRHNVERTVLRTRLDYAKRIRHHLDAPFDPELIKVPVTVLWGDRDRLCMPKGAQGLADALPHAEIVMLEGIGHTPQIEEPDSVVAAVGKLAAAAR